MAARVMLLILTAGVFIALWSGDHQRSECKRPRERSERPNAAADRVRKTTRLLKGDRPTRESAEVSRADKPSASTGDAPIVDSGRTEFWNTLIAWLVREASVPVAVRETEPIVHTKADELSVLSVDRLPLPGGITPGDYRIVRSDGQVTRMVITAEELVRREMPPTEPSRSFYLLHDGRWRWYFIRVESKPAMLTQHAVRSAEVGRTPVATANRSEPAVAARKPRPTDGVTVGWWNWPLFMLPVSTSRQWLVETATQIRTGVTIASAHVVRHWQELTAESMQRLRQAASMPPRLSAEPGSSRR